MRRATAALVLGVWALAAAKASAAPPALAEFGKLPAVEQMRLSPTGDKIAFLAVADDRRRLVVKSVAGATLIAVDVGAVKPRRLTWLGDRHLLLETSNTVAKEADGPFVASVEAAQSTILDVTNGHAFTVFKGAHRILHTTFGFYGFSGDGAKRYAYFGGLTLGGAGSAAADFDQGAGAVDHGHTDLYRVDLDTGTPEIVAVGNELRDLSWVLDDHGAIVAHAEYVKKGEKKGEWRLYADPEDTRLLAKAPDPIGDIGIVGLGRTADSVLVQRPAGAGGDFAVLEYRTLYGAPVVQPFGGEGVREYLSDPVTGLLIGGVTNSDQPRTLLFDSAMQTRFDKVRAAFPGETVTLTSASAGLDKMILHTEGSGDSGTYFLVDYASKKIEAVGWAYPTVLQENVGANRVVAYKAADGLAMQGLLTLPPGREAKSLPLVVLPHGGPELRDYAGFDWWAQAFASRGYAVFQPNFRGSADLGKAFRDAGHGQWGRKMQTDVSDGVAELARLGIIDAKRACVVGGSYGGYVALAGVTVQQGLYRCAVSVGGISDLNLMLAQEAERHGQYGEGLRYLHAFLGVTGDSDPAMNALSPRHLVARTDAPVLLIFGKDDTVVSPVQSLGFAEALRAAGKPVVVLQLAKEDHWMSKAETRTEMLTAAVAFVEKYNPPN